MATSEWTSRWPRRIATATAAAFAMAAIAWGALSLFGRGSQHGAEWAEIAPSDGGAVGPDEAAELAGAYVLGADSDGGLSQMMATIGSAAARAANEKGLSGDGAAIGNACSEALRVYMVGTIEDWDQYLLSHGIEPSSAAHGDEHNHKTMWHYAQRVLSSARFDPEGVHVGAEDADVGSGATLTSRRDDGRAFLRHMSLQERRRAEVVIPGAFRGLSGKVFEGSIGMEFTLDPGAGEWVLTGFNFYNVPSGAIVPGIPL